MVVCRSRFRRFAAIRLNLPTNPRFLPTTRPRGGSAAAPGSGLRPTFARPSFLSRALHCPALKCRATEDYRATGRPAPLFPTPPMPYRAYLPTPPAPAGTVPLPDDEAHHLTRVMRLPEGAAVEALDGLGTRYHGVLTDVTKRGAALRIERTQTVAPPAPALHLLVAPTKNLDRMEWLLEKATELGLARCTPLLTQRAERRELKLDRLRKIAVSALKQSGGAWLPHLDELTPLTAALAGVDADVRLVAHLTHDPAERIGLAAALAGGAASVAVLIGPEGDFTPAEVSEARAAGFRPVTLGDTVLRTETAALLACCAVRVVTPT